MSIEILSPEVSAKIAAGEVIDRPASAVKELVENSLDAGATRIAIELQGGGIEYIRIIDDGAGIPHDQVEVAFRRFATSKLTFADDLDSVSTLGFRGEALPSIASIARVEMRSRTRESDSGTRVEIDGGEILSIGATGSPLGTSVTVRHLFRSFPVRRRFLRSAASEQSRIHQVVSHYAMAYPEVRFELSADRGRSLASPGSGVLREAVAAVHGRQVAEAMLDLDSENVEDHAPKVWGLIGPPSMDRANRRYISLFANRRWVHNRSLSYAVEQSYHGFMAERRYPVVVLNVRVPFEEVDVNTHPSKADIRFRRESSVFGAVQRAVRRALLRHAPVPEVSHGGVVKSSSSAVRSPSLAAFWPTIPFSTSDHRSPADHQGATRTDHHNFTGESGRTQLSPLPSPVLTPKEALPILRVLGQVQNTYVVAEGPDGMYLIDQHAAHERVVFERVRELAASGEPEIQSLLEPSVVELDIDKMELISAQGRVFSGMGFVLEPFGSNSVVIRGVPSLLTDSDQSRALLDVLDLMEDGGGYETWEDRAAFSIACHGAIRAGKVLSRNEMQELVRQLERCVQPNTCPHGRPTMIHMSSGQLEREFHRT